MGGSFGGYMANWVATQTDRFRAIVTHASLWDLDAFTGTTDAAYYWEKEWGDPLREPKRYEQNSPHRYADAIRTPMLVIHGDKDYRVPIGEALRLWYDLQKRGIPSKFLYFPDENHWVLTPGNSDHLVRDGARLPGRARAGRGVAASRAALTRPPAQPNRPVSPAEVERLADQRAQLARCQAGLEPVGQQASEPVARFARERPAERDVGHRTVAAQPGTHREEGGRRGVQRGEGAAGAVGPQELGRQGVRSQGQLECPVADVPVAQAPEDPGDLGVGQRGRTDARAGSGPPPR